MNNIEEKLWDYIDGNCTPDEQKAMELLINQDEACKQKYQELLRLNMEIAAVEPDEPSMAFTYNVIEAIRAEQARQPLKAQLNQRIIMGIAAFFILTIVGILIFVVSTIHLQAAGTAGNRLTELNIPRMKNFFTAPVIKGFLIFDIVLALFLFDSWLRRRNVAKAV